MKKSKIDELLDVEQVMLDNETMGTHADSPIIAIGAVPFTFRNGPILEDKFYVSIKLDSVLDSGANVTGSTICWWMEQKEEARRRFFEKAQTTEAFELEQALMYFSQWMFEMGNRVGSPKLLNVWGNGPTFDCGMLAETYRRIEQEVPWAFWRERCFRTYCELGEAHGVHKGMFKRKGTHHDAVDDAVFQATVAAAIGRQLLTGEH
jgi:hypothetical protein